MPEKETLERARQDAEGREVSQHTGGRVRSRGDASHPRRKARSGVYQTGDRYRLIQGTTIGCKTVATKRLSFLQHTEAGGSRLAKRAV